MIYLLDSNHIVAHLNGDPRIGNGIAQARLAGDEFGIATIVLGELYFGAYNSQRVQYNLGRINNALPDFIVFDFDRDAAEEFGKIRTELRAQGTPIPIPDIQIAAVARSRGFTLLTSDQHFSHINGLVVEDWLI